MFPRFIISLLLLLGGFRFSVYGAQTFWPAAIPLAVRTPYLNAWMYTQPSYAASTNNWPSFWNTNVSSVHSSVT